MRVFGVSAVVVAALMCSSCGDEGSSSNNVTITPAPTATPTASPTPSPTPPQPVKGLSQSPDIAAFTSPWALKVMPDGRFLVTQRSNPGGLLIVTTGGAKVDVSNVPDSVGLLDVVLSPNFTTSRLIVFSYVVRDTSAPRIGRAKDDLTLFPERLMVASAKLLESGGAAQLTEVKELFRQDPTIVAFPGSGEFGGRIVFTPDNRYLIISSGDRQELDKDFLFKTDNNIGKMIRLRVDGTVPSDNPFITTAGSKAEIWTLGHRNPYGLVFTPNGRLWSSEMGPKGGDELNIIGPGKNYGWPAVSNGDNYDGSPIPDHSPGDGFEAPRFNWTPVIAPAGMIYYDGDEFADWRGSLLLTGLQYKGIVRVELSGDNANEVQRIDLGTRIRDIARGPGGSLWIITDGATGVLRRITPNF